MGIWDFVEEAGKKKRAADQSALAAGIEREMGKLGLLKGAEGFSIDVKDGVATLKGVVPSLEQKEKLILATGNVFSIKSVNDDGLIVRTPVPEEVQLTKGELAPAPTPTTMETAARFYTVQKGDTLSKIAKEMYGKASKYPVIFEANRPMLTDPDKIYPGQVLRIPEI